MDMPSIVVFLVLAAIALLQVALLRRDPATDSAAILALLWTADAPIEESEIARNRQMKPADITRALAHLREHNLVRCIVDPDTDRHFIQAAITRDGKEQPAA